LDHQGGAIKTLWIRRAGIRLGIMARAVFRIKTDFVNIARNFLRSIVFKSGFEK
jgi:hypothetical protein